MGFGRQIVLVVGLLLLLSCLDSCPPQAAEWERDPNVISVLSYNVHGLFALAARDDPHRRSPTIGWLANRYDVVLLQEDFEYHTPLTVPLLGKIAFRGNGVGYDPARLVPKLLLAPFAALIPYFWPPYGSGLTVAARDDLVADRGDVERIAFENCSGWFGGRMDCWSAKGFVRLGLRLPNGAEADVYATHLDSGPDRSSQAARWKQLQQIAALIEARGRERTVILGGDLNLDPKRPGDGWIMESFKQRVGLLDSKARGTLDRWKQRDYVLYRAGSSMRVSVEAAGEALEFVNGDDALSDHPAIYVRLRIVPSTAGEADLRGDEQ